MMTKRNLNVVVIVTVLVYALIFFYEKRLEYEVGLNVFEQQDEFLGQIEDIVALKIYNGLYVLIDSGWYYFGYNHDFFNKKHVGYYMLKKKGENGIWISKKKSFMEAYFFEIRYSTLDPSVELDMSLLKALNKRDRDVVEEAP